MDSKALGLRSAEGATERLRLLYDLACAFAAHTELDDLIPLVVTKCRETLDSEGAAVLLLDESGDQLHFPYVAENDPEIARRLIGLRFPSNRGIAGEVLRTGRPLRVDDVRNDPRFYQGVDEQSGLRTSAVLAVPLVSRQGPIGVIEVVNHREGRSFADDDLAFLEILAGSIAIAIENAQLYARIKGSEEKLRAQLGALRRDMAHRERFPELVGSSPAMNAIFRLMESAAPSTITVLVEGETGTGKELVARGIHAASPRAEEPFLAVNCVALSETLLESELFGHRKGSFTGATQDQRGLFEAASDGTIFLDEVGEMPPTMQAKLLRVLQQGEIIPVGETRPRKVDVRVISATNRDLRAEVAARRFREDLYYRLAVFPIRLPPLRDRREDIPLLADHIMDRVSGKHSKRIRGIEPLALEAMIRFDWPGNVRQLENEIERAVALTRDGESVSLAHLSQEIARVSEEAEDVFDILATAGEAEPTEVRLPDDSIQDQRAAFEARLIAETLRKYGGNVSQTARVLRVSRPTLHKKIKQYGLERL